MEHRGSSAVEEGSFDIHAHEHSTSLEDPWKASFTLSLQGPGPWTQDPQLLCPPQPLPIIQVSFLLQCWPRQDLLLSQQRIQARERALTPPKCQQLHPQTKPQTAFNPTQEAETGGSREGLVQAGLQCELQASQSYVERSCLKRAKKTLPHPLQFKSEKGHKDRCPTFSYITPKRLSVTKDPRTFPIPVSFVVQEIGQNFLLPLRYHSPAHPDPLPIHLS